VAPWWKRREIDIVASSPERDFLIDVKRYRVGQPVTVELVLSVYGVAHSVGGDRPDRIVQGGIITSTRFTKDAEEFKNGQASHASARRPVGTHRT
jgi:hypothetical protein